MINEETREEERTIREKKVVCDIERRSWTKGFICWLIDRTHTLVIYLVPVEKRAKRPADVAIDKV